MNPAVLSLTKKKKDHLKESEGRHPTSPALFVLGTEHPQLLHLPSTFIRLLMIEVQKIKQKSLTAAHRARRYHRHPSEPHLDAEAVVCGCTVLLFACDNCEDVAVFKVCQ